tara:strand:+ start:2246 stop:2833 length:588 start_codon:yes stop_codon:yes gene_type:complete
MKNKIFDRNTIIVLDDVISKTYQNSIEDAVTSNGFIYHFTRDISTDSSSKVKNFGFSRQLKWNSEENFDPFHYMMIPLLNEAFFRIKKEISHIFRGRIFMSTSGTPNEIDMAHVDDSIYHMVLLYYVNDSTGDTYLFEEFHEENTDIDLISPDKLTIKDTVTPKKGRVLIFNGLRYHSSSRPKLNNRIVINYNLI